MNRKQFTVIRGGLLDRAETSKKEFISAYATDTRLMGVVGLYIHFALPDNPTEQELHQFFYFDAEEYGFETYRSLLGHHPGRKDDIENSLIGGLGGKKIPLTFAEAKALLRGYAAFNKERHLPLPDGYLEYGFLLQDSAEPGAPEQDMLMEKICVRPRSPHELIHYYMMRRFGKDMTGMRHLSCREPDKSSLSSLSMGTLLRNSIDKDKEENAYLCESLVETGDHYYLVISEITLCGDLVDTCQEISVLKISPSETAMMLTRSEFVTVYNAADVGELSRKTLQRLKKGATVSAHDTGRLFMYFRPNNDHVNQQQYQLNEDVAGLCYFTENGQIICAAYSLRDILKMEKRMEAILSSPKTDGLGSLSSLFRKVPRYEFQEPVVYEYIQSGFEDFHTFVEAIKT